MPIGTHSMMFIHTYKEWDDASWQLIVKYLPCKPAAFDNVFSM